MLDGSGPSPKLDRVPTQMPQYAIPSLLFAAAYMFVAAVTMFGAGLPNASRAERMSRAEALPIASVQPARLPDAP
jgi:hypothetical protein